MGYEQQPSLPFPAIEDEYSRSSEKAVTPDFPETGQDGLSRSKAARAPMSQEEADQWEEQDRSEKPRFIPPATYELPKGTIRTIPDKPTQESPMARRMARVRARSIDRAYADFDL